MKEIRDRLAVIETKFNERWDAHDKRSEENWGYVREKLDTISNVLPTHTAEICHLKNMQKWTWGTIGSAISVAFYWVFGYR